MSYAHTKRRKNIAKWKKQFPKDWRNKLANEGERIRKINDGPLLGSLTDLMPHH